LRGQRSPISPRISYAISKLIGHLKWLDWIGVGAFSSATRRSTIATMRAVRKSFLLTKSPGSLGLSRETIRRIIRFRDSEQATRLRALRHAFAGGTQRKVNSPTLAAKLQKANPPASTGPRRCRTSSRPWLSQSLLAKPAAKQLLLLSFLAHCLFQLRWNVSEPKSSTSNTPADIDQVATIGLHVIRRRSVA
jgi:hypothetical protein